MSLASEHPLAARILAQSLSAADALSRCGSAATDANSWASRERRTNQLLGVWSRTQSAFVHPEFQFGAKGRLPQLQELLEVLASRIGFDPEATDRGGWQRAYWLYQPDKRLSEAAITGSAVPLGDIVAAAKSLRGLDPHGRTPAEMFASEPDRVIALARELATAT